MAEQQRQADDDVLDDLPDGDRWTMPLTCASVEAVRCRIAKVIDL